MVSDFPHRASPHVRAAFEAGQNSLILVTESNYALAGAKVWVHSYVRERRMGERYGDHPEPETHELKPAEMFDRKLTELQRLCEKLAPGSGAIVPEARKVVETQPKRPDNWMGRDPSKLLPQRYDLLAQALRMQAPANIDGVTAAAYSALSRDTHLKVLTPSAVVRRSDGSIGFKPPSMGPDHTRIRLLAGLTSAVWEAVLAASYRATECSLASA